MSAAGTDREGPEGIGIMELAYGFVAQTLQTHDELVAGRLNEHRRAAADRREIGRASGRERVLYPV